MKYQLIALLLSPLFFLQGIDIEKLSLEEKVGQLLLVHFHGASPNEDAEELLKKGHVGGFIYFNWSNELSSPKEVQALSIGLQRLNQKQGSTLPLLLAVDQEGGRVNRLKKGFTEFPSQETVAKTGVKSLGQRTAFAIGEELRAVGINLNLSPVVDVNSNPKNRVIGTRAFGSDPREVADWGQSALEGYRKAGIIATLKHYPGHGDADADSHAVTPRVNKSKEALYEIELYPFKKLAESADVIMTAHLLATAIDPVNPATFSKPLLQGILRGEFHFSGVILSDSMAMKGISDWAATYEEAALMALNAGCDLLCLGGKLLNGETQNEINVSDVLRIHAFLIEAVKEGRYKEEHLNRSVQRILDLKKKYELTSWSCLEILPEGANLSTEEHQNLKDEIILLSSIQSALSQEIQEEMGRAIWKNESGGKGEGLLSWNPSEAFLSLGIGHFIWYPEDIRIDFEEGFPLYLSFLKRRHIALPPSLEKCTSAPWKSQDVFLKEKNGPLAKEMREWLASTFDLQAAFMVERMLDSLDEILFQAPREEVFLLIESVKDLTQTTTSIFALVDYINFKGSGLAPKERYQGKGWGLYQVLTKMTTSKEEPALRRFQKAATDILTERVALAPKERKEERWLPGWKNRIARYSDFSFSLSQPN